MENTLTFNLNSVDITFDDLDIDKELPIVVSDNAYDKEMTVYLTKENVISLKKHLDYVLKQM